MIVGFTGTRHGMTEHQHSVVFGYLLMMRDEIHAAHHGDCIGSDAEFHAMCIDLGIDVVIHPPTDARHRAFCEGAMLVGPELPYLRRNLAIVAACDTLLATPREQHEPAPARGQGTWSTIRYARRLSKHLVIVDQQGEGYG